MPLVHLPVQSGSNKILKLMNRNHNIEYYLQIYEKIIKRSDFRGAHIAPHTLKVASMFSVMSRLQQSKK